MEDEVIDIDDDDILDTKTINEPENLTKEIVKDDSESSVVDSQMEVSDIENDLESTQFGIHKRRVTQRLAHILQAMVLMNHMIW